MNPSQHAEQFQSQLANYVPLFTPQFWPVWLIIAGLLLVGMWLVLGLHALLRARGVKKSATDHGEKVLSLQQSGQIMALVECVTLCIVAGKWADKSLCAGGRNCG